MKPLFPILFSLALLFAACSRDVDETPLFTKYADRHNLTVAQVSGFRLSDSVKVDVVILVADDTETWNDLKTELNIRGQEGVTSWIGRIDNPAIRSRSGLWPLWRAMAVHDEKTVAFYRVENQRQLNALREFQIDNKR